MADVTVWEASGKPDKDVMCLAAELIEAARTGDWERLEALSARLPEQTSPATEADIAVYLSALQASIILAKVTRADLLKSLHRLTAASGFIHCAE